MDTIQNIERILKNIMVNSTPVVDDPVYLFDAASFAKSPDTGHTSSSEIDTRVSKRLSIVCSNTNSTNMQIVVTGFNTSGGTIPVVIATIELDATTSTGGFTTTDLYPFTKVTVNNLDTINAGTATVTYVITR